MKKLLILGGSGLLGSTLTSGYYLKKYNINSHSLRSKTNLKADLEDKDQIIKLIEQVKPEIIINLVGLTNVDYCEKFPNAAYRLNIKTVENIVDAIKKFSFKPFLIHISTDQVYDSEGLSLEKNINLTNFYSFSKFCGANDIITPITPKDEDLRRQLGFRGAQNFKNVVWHNYGLKNNGNYYNHMSTVYLD